MRSNVAESRSRRPANLTIDSGLLEEAKALGINVSRAAESGISRAVSEEKGRLWKIENAEAIRSYNEWVEKNGLPLADYRQF